MGAWGRILEDAILALAFSAIASPLESRQSCADVTVSFARGLASLERSAPLLGFHSKVHLARKLSNLSALTTPPTSLVSSLAVTRVAPPPWRTASRQRRTLVRTSRLSFQDTEGAQVTHIAAGKLSASIRERVNAAVVFGDPKKGQAFPDPINARTKAFCELLDNIYAGRALILPCAFGI
ncbi:hypothetical protein D9615_006847 [Tricholomella constricta]|uniref:cutinase n=1 Tax=Tricholomella constricta TaxID=117010 RepID=A0A8H5H8R7_9AGAR|nr:hypothetical protein D9615_006847 [Tricholomella constricta]